MVVSYSIFAVLVARQIGATAEQVEAITTMALLASAVGVFFQSLKRGPIGSGYLAAHVSSIIYIPASIAAGNAGGLALISGMTVATGATSRVIGMVMAWMLIAITCCPKIIGVVSFLPNPVMGGVLSLLFRIGISRHAKLVLSSGPGAMDKAHQFLKRVAADWRLTREVLTRASGAMTGWVNSQAARSLPGGSTDVEVTFDEIELAIHIRCPIEESVDRKETPTEKASAHPLFPLDQTCTSLFSSYADRVKTHLEDGFFCMTLFFDA